ncbi:transketolase family protein [Myceligenerans cantabricum]
MTTDLQAVQPDRQRVTPTRETTVSTREAYRDTLVDLTSARPEIVVLDTDTGLFPASAFSDHPERYVNVGIAEHTLVGTASGLARQGFRPVINTMAAFAASRAIEAVKLDVALPGLPVLVAGTHSGLSAGHLGPTHHGLEDLGAMRMLPHMAVLVPADACQAAALTRQAADLPGPAYLRLGRNPTPDLAADDTIRIGEIQVLRDGGDVLIAACGGLPVHAALDAAGRLAERGVSAGVVNVHTVKPLDVERLLPLVAGHRRVVTVEEHWCAGGMGSAVVEALTEHLPVRASRIGVPDTFVSVPGSHPALLDRVGISATRVAARVMELLERSDAHAAR